MKGRYWDSDHKKPMVKLKSFLEEQANSIQKRVKTDTGIDIIRPVYYSAEYNYNIDKLLDLFVDNMPKSKRDLIL